ncbi:MAG TPA: hypothetical protein VMT38_08280 [Terracidiphilus sp.]|nr:hypothetical protein [Terracidiphilus sp.]
MGLRHYFWNAALAATLSVPLVAQQAPSGYHAISCVRVKPGQSAAFRDLLNGDYSKVEQARVDSGAVSAFIALRTVIPAGTDAGCDWVLVTFYPGLPSAPLSDDEMTAVLQKAGVASTLQQWHDHLSAVAELVSNNITQYQVLVGGSKKGDYLVFNSMKAADRGECVAAQKRLWQPFAEEGVKEGAQDGWAINIQRMPEGAKDPSLVSSVDIYPSWNAMFNYFGPDFTTRWKKVHPEMTTDDAFAILDKVCTIEHTVTYKVEAQINSSK